MKIVKLQGGIGNQMFQYAFAKAIGNDVLFDNSWFSLLDKSNRPSHAIYGLDLLNTDLKFATKEQISTCLEESALATKITNFYKIFHIKLLHTNRVYEKIRNKYEPEICSIDGNAYYDGYFQTYKYFENIKSNLIKDFAPKKEMTKENLKILDNIRNTNSITISIRRSDYVKLGVALPAEYYNLAIEEIAKQVENPVFYMFSDDIDWCTKNIGTDNKYKIIPCDSFDKNCGYVCGIYLMSNTKHNIITNSTYPWWAAWLNDNPNRIIIAPKVWIKTNGIVRATFEDLIPNNWIRL